MNLADLDRALLWHPFSPMREWLGEPPLVIERAEGNELVDSEGRRYLDGVSSLWVNVHGHRHPHIDAAVTAQLGRVAHTTLLGLASTPSIQLAQKLLAVAPRGLARVFFSDSGSTAVEVALKIAFQYQHLRGFPRRTRFLALDGAYHGDTIGAVSVGGIDTFHRIFHPLLFHTTHVAPDAAMVERAIAMHADELCAVIMEPLVQGAAGIRLMPPGLLAAAARACREHGVLLIADEVATGFGRTGTMFACEQEGVTPDLMAIAKGLSGGYLPVAATLCTDDVFSAFLGEPDQRLTFFHGHSFGGNALGCAAAIASLEVFERERTLESLPAKIEALGARLAAKVAPLSPVFEIRHKGMMAGIELRGAGGVAFDGRDAIGARVCRRARAHGVLLRPLGDVVVLMPPLSITREQVARLVDAAAAAITETLVDAPALSRPLSPATGAGVAHGAGAGPVARTGLFVVGTDTGVGKTAVACALLHLARQRGHRPAPWKPVETGVVGQPGDALSLRAAAGRDDLSIEVVCPFAFAPPVAAAALSGPAATTVTLPALLLAATQIFERGNLAIVESAGGLLSPYAADVTVADLAAALGLPVLLVARNALGTINHTALTVAEIRRRALPLAGVLLVDTSPEPTPDRASNARLIEAATGIRPLGVLPFVPGADATALAAALSAAIDVDDLFRRLTLR